MTNTNAVQINVTGVTISLSANALKVVGSLIKSGVESQVPVLGADITIDVASADPTGGGADSQTIVEVYYYEV